MTRIKRNKFGMGILVAFICLCAVGCHDSGGDQDMQLEAISETEEGLYISNTAPEKCYLCGTPEQSLLPFYEGQTNLGIISLNTFEFVPIEINRYNDYGNLIEEPAGFSSTSMQNTGENGFTAYVTPNHDRGYANATIYFEKLRCLIKLFLRFSLEININTKQNRTVHRIFQTIISTKFRIPQFERRET